MELLVQRRMLLLLEADGEDCPKVAEMTSWLGAPTLLCCLARCMALRQQSKALVLQMYPAASLVHLLACGSSSGPPASCSSLCWGPIWTWSASSG